MTTKTKNTSESTTKKSNKITKTKWYEYTNTGPIIKKLKQKQKTTTQKKTDQKTTREKTKHTPKKGTRPEKIESERSEQFLVK